MITDNDLNFIYNGTKGIALTWVIDEQCLYDLPLTVEHANLFLRTDQAVDISDQYPEHNGITLKLLNDGQELEIFQTSEYFGNILLSNPLVLNLADYKNGRYVEGLNAKFINNEFVIIE